MVEEWKDVVGYKGYYQVSNLGRVKSLPRIVCRVGDGNKHYSAKEKILKPFKVNKHGHVAVDLLKGGVGTRKVVTVHRLVLEAFVGPCPLGMECRHFPDRDPTNNCLDNISWGTHLDNVLDMYICGSANDKAKGRPGHKPYFVAPGHMNPNARFDAGQIRAIRKNYAKITKSKKAGVVIKMLSVKFHCCADTIRDIVRGVSYINVE